MVATVLIRYTARGRRPACCLRTFSRPPSLSSLNGDAQSVGQTRRVSGIARCVQALFLPAVTSPFDGARSMFCPSSQLRSDGGFLYFMPLNTGGRHMSARHRTPTSTGMHVCSRPSLSKERRRTDRVRLSLAHHGLPPVIGEEEA